MHPETGLNPDEKIPHSTMFQFQATTITLMKRILILINLLAMSTFVEVTLMSVGRKK